MNLTLNAVLGNPILRGMHKKWAPRPGGSFLCDVLYDLNQRSDLSYEENVLRQMLAKMPKEQLEAYSRHFH